MKGAEIRETIGLAAVVASLIFVGMEIRQTNQLARQESLRHLSERWLTANVPMMTDERMSGLIQRVIDGEAEADFEEADRMSLHLLFFTLNQTYQTSHRELSLGLLSDEDYKHPAADDPFWNSRFHRDIWPRNRDAFSDDFARAWEERFSLTGG